MPLTGWAGTNSFENFREYSLKRDLSKDTTDNQPLFSLVNTFKQPTETPDNQQLSLDNW